MDSVEHFRVQVDDKIEEPNSSLYPLLFNSFDYISLIQDNGKIKHFELINNITDSAVAQITFICENQLANSLPSSPFGGFTMVDEGIEGFEYFVNYLVRHFAKNHIKKITIKNQALAFKNSVSQIVSLSLQQFGFKTLYNDINHHIAVNENPFFELLHKMEKRKIKRAKDMGFKCKLAERDEWKDIYDFIANCRVEKGVVINISFQKLSTFLETLPNSYHAFKVVTPEGIIAAATICVKVGPNILYNYLPASPNRYNHISPMVLLMEGVYNYCQHNDFSMLDLGVSSEKGEPQEGLLTFKERIGGIQSKKPMFSLHL